MKPEEITKYMEAVADGFIKLSLKMKQPAEYIRNKWRRGENRLKVRNKYQIKNLKK